MTVPPSSVDPRPDQRRQYRASWTIEVPLPRPSLCTSGHQIECTYIEACEEARRLFGEGHTRVSVFACGNVTPWYTVRLAWVTGRGFVPEERDHNTNSGLVLLTAEELEALAAKPLANVKAGAR
jgi:hypothetical protein